MAETMRIKDFLRSGREGPEIMVEGWIRTRRDSKTVSFLEVNDGSCLTHLQVVFDQNLKDFEGVNQRLTNGASVRISGKAVPSAGSGQKLELLAESIEVLGDSHPEEYPLQKKRHSMEFLREIAHLRPRTNIFGAVARVRNHMSFAIHRFFQERGFLLVHTPIITGSDCEGAGEMFQVTTLAPGKIPPGGADYSQDFFGKKASLTVSGQLEGETFACALKKIYTFGPTFRAENSNTARHLAEFWMVEPEMAFCDISGNMDLAEEFLRSLFRSVLEECSEDMEFFDSRVSPGVMKNLEDIAASPFERITYSDAVERLLKSGERFEFPVTWGADLQSEHEKILTEKIYRRPLIVTDYPAKIKAFYMKRNDDGKTVRAMDILVPRLGEIIGGSEREADYQKLKERIEGADLNPADYWWYLDLRRFGSVPHSGFGLGFERTVQFVTGVQNIRDAIPFPRCVNTLDF